MIAAFLLALALANPYSGTQPSDFPPPTPPACPSGQQYDAQCVAACADLYQAEMQIAFEHAASAWEITESVYGNLLDEIDDALQDCLDSQAERLFCWIAWEQQCGALNEWRTDERKGIEDQIDADIDHAQQSFFNCVSDCCVEVLIVHAYRRQ